MRIDGAMFLSPMSREDKMKKQWLLLATLLIFGFCALAAQGGATLYLSTSTLDFGDVNVGSVEYMTVMLDAVGSTGTSVEITNIQTFGSVYFSIESAPSLPATIIAMNSASIEIAYEPYDTDPHAGDLVITESGGAQHHVYLSGTGVVSGGGPVIQADPATFDFGSSVPLYGSAYTTINVTRSPSAVATAAVISAEISGTSGFSLDPVILNAVGAPVTLPVFLDATGMAVFTVHFNPVTPEPQTATVTFTDNHSNTVTTTLFGIAAPSGVPQIQVIPSVINTTMAHNSMSSGSFEIHNTGTDVLNFDIYTADVPGFMVLDLFSGSVPPSSFQTVGYQIYSDGLPSGLNADQLGITSNDPTAATYWMNVNVTVLAMEVVVDFSGSPLTGHAPLAVGFTDETVYDPADATTAPQGWRWDFDDDGIIDSFLQNPTHTYTSPGTYSVRLTVFTNTGAIHECLKTDYITVTNNPPTVDPGAFTEQEFMEDTVGGPFSLIGMFIDPEGDPLTLVFNGSAHILGHIDNYNDLYLNATQDWYGTENVSITAHDPYGEGVTHQFSVTVLPVNDAPSLTVPTDFYFIRNSDFIVNFAQYISDPDNAMNELSIVITRTTPDDDITFVYMPTNAPNIPGQFQVKFSSLRQTPTMEGFQITVNDNARRAISTHQFNMHLLDHFEPNVLLGAIYQYAGQTVDFTDGTLGNPTWWTWEFGDGQTANVQNPAHTYPNAGTYDIRLTLGNTQANEQASIFIPAMIHLTGTSVVDGDIPPVWTELGSPYNLYGDIQIEDDQTIDIEPNVEINLFGDQPLVVVGVLNANLARFRSQSDSGQWGGLKFVAGSRLREPSTLTDCDIVDAMLPIEIDGQSPQISGVNITITDPSNTVIMPGPGIKISGESAPVLSDIEIDNYAGGLLIETEGTSDRNTPTLTNIRIQNSNESSRDVPENSTGLTLTGMAIINDLEVDNFSTGIVIDNQDRSRTTTPTLTNIRVRNSNESSRSILNGMRISGDTAPNIDDLDIQDVTNGLLLESVDPSTRATPTLTNIRIQNSNESSRTESYGLGLINVSSVNIDTAEIVGFNSGIKIETDTRELSTPTLTNIRVRNSNESSRQENVGVDINGSVIAQIDDMIVEDYPFGIKYFGVPMRDLSTPTLTNIRVRNSNESSRQGSIGIQIKDLLQFTMENDSIGCFEVGLEIMNETGDRTLSTPTLTNIRVRNSDESSRYENVGIFLGPDVAGTLTGADVEDAIIGIFLADGNQTILNPARVFNCGTGIKASGSASSQALKRHLIVLEQAFANEHPLWDFNGMEVSLAGPWNIHNNTIAGYYTSLKATNATVQFRSNIAWSNGPSFQPFDLTASNLQVSYCDVNTPQVYQGVGNINTDPVFADPPLRDYNIMYNSPCIDAGDPALPNDLDGTVNDIGAFRYLHRSSFNASARFIQTGSVVDFTNTSLGHDYPFSNAAWDLNADGSVEAISRDWSYQFNEPGFYSMRLTMSTGGLIDIKTYDYYIVVQNHLLQAPQNVDIALMNNNILLDWDPVEQTIQGLPINVDFYLVYQSQNLGGIYDFVGFTLGNQTDYIHSMGGGRDRNFYIILGFSGSRGELDRFIEENRAYRPGVAPVPELRTRQ
jgi:PKD repeat protein